jgi:molybdopterin converting factor small subunit
MKLVFPGKFGDLAGTALSDFQRPSQVRTLSDLTMWLAKTRPALGEAMRAARAKAIVNHALVHDPLYILGDDDEVAFLPPMSGG